MKHHLNGILTISLLTTINGCPTLSFFLIILSRSAEGQKEHYAWDGLREDIHSLVLLQGARMVSVVLEKSPSGQFSVNTGVSSSLFCSVHITQTDEQSASALLCGGRQETLEG